MTREEITRKLKMVVMYKVRNSFPDTTSLM